MARKYERIGDFYIFYRHPDEKHPEIRQYQMLGMGNFGAVYLGQFQYGTETIPVAVKIVPGDLQVDLRRRQIFLREAELLMTLKSKPGFHDSHVVQLYGFKLNEGKGYLFEQLCEGNLTDVMESKARPDAFVAKYFQQILVGLDFMHSNQVIHRDLKPDNILIDKLGSIKIADFGLSRMFESSNELQMTSGVGTFIYQAPEVANHEYDQRCDVWSAGLILYQLLTGISWATVTEDQIYERNLALRQGTFNLSFPGRDAIWQRLLKKMLAYRYKERWSSKEILTEYLDWFSKAQEKQAQLPEPASIFKTYTQYEKGKRQQGHEQAQVAVPAQASQEDVEQKQAEQRLIQSLGVDNHFPSVRNYIEYLSYYHHYKHLTNITIKKILDTMGKDIALKSKFNSFFILTNQFFAKSIVFLRYKELLQEMEKLQAGQTIEKTLDEKQKMAYIETIEIKKQKFKAYVDDYIQNYKGNVKAYLQYQSKLPKLPHYNIVFDYLSKIKSQEQITFSAIVEHQAILLEDIDTLLSKEEITKMREDEVTVAYLCKRLREITQEMREGFKITSSAELKSIRESTKKGASLSEMLAYLKEK